MKLILKDYENFIYKTARSISRRNPHIDLDDLIQSGWLGLLEAYNKFDESFNVKFLTYASFYVKKHMKETVHKNTIVEYPRDLTRIFFKLEKAKSALIQANEDVTKEKLAKQIGISVKKLNKYESYFQGFFFIHEVDDIENPEIDDLRFETIRTVLDELTDPQRDMLLERLEGKKLIEIGAKHNLCAERIRQLLEVVYATIRRKINAIH